MKRLLVIIGLMSLAVWVVYLYLGRLPLGIDDAYIFFVYGKNVSAGYGIVYTPGGERIEGYTSPLWMLITAIGFTLFHSPEFFLLVISVLSISVGLTAIWYFVDGTDRITLRGLLFLAWVFSSPSFVLWVSLPLMDTALWSALLMLSTATVLSAPVSNSLTVLIALLILTRPEGMLWGLVFIAIAWLMISSRQGTSAVWPKIRSHLAAYGFTLGGLVIFRMIYFGYPLPNTYYAKISPDILYNLWLGMSYLILFIYTHMQVLVGLVSMLGGIFLSLMWWAKGHHIFDEWSIRYLALSLIMAISLLIPVWTGGDHFRLFRFYQSSWPLFILPIFGLLEVIRPRIPHFARYGLATGMGLIFFAIPQEVNWYNHLYSKALGVEFRIAQNGRETGTTLNALFKDLPTVGVIVAGGIAFEYKGRVIDMMGLNNLMMAHAPGHRYGYKDHAAFNANVFFIQRPDLVLPLIGSPETLVNNYQARYEWPNQILKGLLQDSHFKATYQLALISDTQHTVMAYVERNYLNRLMKRGFDVKLVDN